MDVLVAVILQMTLLQLEQMYFQIVIQMEELEVSVDVLEEDKIQAIL